MAEKYLKVELLITSMMGLTTTCGSFERMKKNKYLKKCLKNALIYNKNLQNHKLQNQGENGSDVEIEGIVLQDIGKKKSTFFSQLSAINWQSDANNCEDDVLYCHCIHSSGYKIMVA